MKKTNRSSHSLYLLIWLAFLSLAQPFAALAQTTTPAPLPSAAQEALGKGIIAAKVPDYLLAIRYFEEARKIAPEAPLIYLNLGLAESKIPGRELRAIAWFGAYLAADPDAPNAAAVKEQFAALDEKNQTTVSRLLTTVQDAADKIVGDSRSGKLLEVTQMWLNFGDIAAARRTAALIRGGSKDDKENRSEAEVYIAAANGDFEGARKIAVSELQSAYQKSSTLFDIADKQVAAGDMAGAKKTLADAAKLALTVDQEKGLGIQSSWAIKGQLQEMIVEAQAKAGDIAGANKTADQIISKKDQNVSFHKSSALSTIALALAKTGAVAAAKKSLTAAETAAGLIEVEDTWHKDRAHSSITKAQATAGDIAGAQKVADSINDAGRRAGAIESIAVAQAEAGDLAAAKSRLVSAQKAIDRILKPDDRSRALIQLAEVQVRIGDKSGATATILAAQASAGTIPNADDKRKVMASIVNLRLKLGSSSAAVPWLTNLDEGIEYSRCLLNSAPILDLSAYLKSLPSDDARQIFKGLFDAARQISNCRQVITKMLKQQAQPPSKL